MQIGNRFRIYPTQSQAQTLLRWIGCQRFIYNAKVGEDRYFRRFARASLAHAGQFSPIDQQYSQFKTELTPWLSEVPSPLLRNGAVLFKQAYSRYFQKLGGRPAIHRKTGPQSVWVTSELFEFKPVVDALTGEIITYTLHLGTRKFPVGELDMVAHKPFKPAASIHISVHAGRWHVSFNHEDGQLEPSEQDTIDWLVQHTENDLRAVTVGLDRGVAQPLATSTGAVFDFQPIHRKRMARQERHKKRWQRKQARRTKGSKNWGKAKSKVARYQRYAVDVRREVAHQASHALASDDRYRLFVFEALKVQNMTRAPKAKQDDQGRWLRNGAKAKARMNKSILASAWGQTKTYLSYKARRKGKLSIEVPAFYSSQECAQCGHVHSDNRISQSEFVCQRCGHQANADHNAAQVIARRGVRLVLSGAYGKKPKTCRITRQKVGAESSEPASETVPAPGEIMVRREGGNTNPHKSLTQETPATAQA